MLRTLDIAAAIGFLLVGLGALTYAGVAALLGYRSWRRIRRSEDLYDRAAERLADNDQRRES